MSHYRYRMTTFLLLSLLILGLVACGGTGVDDIAPEPDLDEATPELAPLDENANEDTGVPDVDANANETNENAANENADDMNENADDLNENSDDDMNENGDDDNANESTGDVPAGEANLVEVTEEEWLINMPASLPAGLTTFEVTNTGAVVHNFEIEGQDIEEELESDLQPGDTGSLTVDLQPGTYTVYCPISGHDELGMELELIVTEEGS